ncbi:cytochrome c oxidase subunit 3 [Tropicimonas sp.]|uniref:cytochrome c oxidase subunit 3 n=1 Tax=Tropicimonas sp. TaxID=2067044 RepID=UPI003A89B276
MAHEKNHDYVILPPSIWPFMGAVGGFVMLFGAVLWMKGITPFIFFAGALTVLYVMYGWWSDTISENEAGEYTPVVRIGLRYGVILFIISEVMFFVAWFWSFIKHAMYPGGPEEPAMYQTWPPQGIEPFDPWHLPLINTLILLCSGMAVTWAHYALVHDNNNRRDLRNGLILAVALGALFTFFQAYEYSHAAFGFAGNIYGANFFMATGFHGAHVIIGTIFLFVCYLRARAGQFTPDSHVGLEAAAWYWHFVDVVWLFLFTVVYIWGS